MFTYVTEMDVSDRRIIIISSTFFQKYSIHCSAPGSLDTSLSHAAGLIEIAACHA